MEKNRLAMFKRLKRLKRLQDLRCRIIQIETLGVGRWIGKVILAGGRMYSYSSICRVVFDVVTEDVRDASLFLVNGVR